MLPVRVLLQDALVDHFIPNATITPNQWYSFTFLVTSRLFIAPHDLLATIASVSQHCSPFTCGVLGWGGGGGLL